MHQHYTPELQRCFNKPTRREQATITLTNKPQTFRISCATNWPDDAESSSPNIYDIMKAQTPDIERCVEVCAEYNAGMAHLGTATPLCRAVSLALGPGRSYYSRNVEGINRVGIVDRGVYERCFGIQFVLVLALWIIIHQVLRDFS
jgi:hypothetical protein